MRYNPAEPRDAYGRWYHGTAALLKPGDVLRPGRVVGKANYDYEAEYADNDAVFVTSDAGTALRYGRTAKADPSGVLTQEPHVYEVEPLSLPTLDPNEPKGRKVRAARVVREVHPKPNRNMLRREAGLPVRKDLPPPVYDLSSPTIVRQPKPTEKHLLTPQVDHDTTVRAIAKVMLASARLHRVPSDFNRELNAIAHLLAPYDIGTRAIRMALGLTHTEGGYRRGTAHAPNARLSEHGATLEGQVRDVRDAEVYYRAAYVANAAQRMQAAMKAGASQAEALRQEAPYYQFHEQARAQRLRSAAQVQSAARLVGQFDGRGTLVGWYLNPLLNNEVECIAANGHNFYAEEGTMIGLPGSVHNRCGCYAGQPIQGATLVNDALQNVVKFSRSRPKFKLKERRVA